MALTENLEIIKDKIQTCCERVGRRPEEITLLAVTKTRTAEEINQAIACGIADIGENKVQEYLNKAEMLDSRAILHFIGQLQSNKVKYIIEKVHLIHSLDRLSLAQEVDKRAKACGRVVDVLAEVNIGSEESKGGIAPGELFPMLESLQDYSNIRLRGLMTVAPAVEEEALQRIYFSRMYNLFQKVRDEYGKDISILSMGMSQDYEAAILEGSNIIRLGTALFGPRNYNI